MSRDEFHDKPYDEGTLTKLRIFELYVQEWVPVFLSKPEPRFAEMHVFDFFSGPGRDANGVAGSPLRILEVLRKYHRKGLSGWDRVDKMVHFFDLNPNKVESLENLISAEQVGVPGIGLDVQVLAFADALERNRAILENPRAAKLLIIDQFGVDAVSDEVFSRLLEFPRTDFVFFLSTSTLHRFRDHPAIKQKIANPADSYHVHRAAFDYFKELIPAGDEAFLGQFSILKRSNIYGLIFGSRHPLGIHKFLQVAWATDGIAGEANFDVDRENVGKGEMLLGFDIMKPKKVQEFEEALEAAFRERRFASEADVIRFCIEAGMTGQHAEAVMAQLKKAGVLEADFRVPNVRNLKDPRRINYL